MKLLIALILLLPAFGFSQQSVDTFHIEGKSIIYKDKKGEYLHHKDWLPCNYTGIIDMPNKRIQIFREGEDMTFLINGAENITDENHKYLEMKLKCTDGRGNKCGVNFITITDPKEPYNSKVTIEYNNATLIYRYNEKEP